MTSAPDALFADAASALGRRDLAGALPKIEILLKQRPRDSKLRHDLAGGLLHAGDAGRALILLSQALALDPAQRVSADMLSRQLKQIALNDATLLAPRGLAAALEVSDVDPQPLVRAAIAWVAQSEAAQGGLSDILALGHREDWDTAARALLDRIADGPVPDDLLWQALTRGLNTDMAIERLLVAVRRRLSREALFSDAADRAPEPPDFVWRALMSQVHNNEHVWPQSAGEAEFLAALPLDTEGLKAGDPAAGRALILHGLYRAVEDIPCLGDGTLDAARLRPVWLARFVAARLESRAGLQAFGGAIPSLGPIADETSARVAAQYEANPYPRWQALTPPRAGAMLDQLKAFVPPSDLAFFDGDFDVLVPGCGTGREAVMTAFSCAPHGSVLAFDLSRASLAYAALAARRYHAPRLSFAQADILNLGALDRQFRLIVCSGVLHHLEEPLDGLRALRKCLHPNGFMRIALYSQLARRDVTRLRETLGADLPRTPEAIRAARARIVVRHWDDLAQPFRASADFYSTSGCRDLFFHEREHQFTIPNLRQMLDAADLAFLGFALPPAMREAFKRWAGSGADLRDLDAWWAYEQAHPRTFSAMYTFWCRPR
jgi:SAM-dependent methyltransferase